MDWEGLGKISQYFGQTLGNRGKFGIYLGKMAKVCIMYLGKYTIIWKILGGNLKEVGKVGKIINARLFHKMF